MFDPNKINKSQSYTGREVDILDIEYDGSETEQAVSKFYTVAIIPYKMDKNHKYIKHIYLTKFPNLYNEKTDISPVTETFEEDTDETFLDTVIRGLYEEIGIDLSSDIENRVNYIGQIKFNKYFNKNIICYCVDISNIQVPSNPGKIDNETLNQVVYKFSLKELMNNIILEDVLSIACIQALVKTHKNQIKYED